MIEDQYITQKIFGRPNDLKVKKWNLIFFKSRFHASQVHRTSHQTRMALFMLQKLHP